MDPHDLALAYALSSVAGLRATLTVLALTVAVHLHALAPPAGAAWLASDTTLAIAAVIALADLLGDKVPLVDNALHAVHAILAPVAGAVAVVAVDPAHDGNVASLALLAALGGANALGIHGVRATTRAASTAATFGMLNPVLSFGGDAVAVAALAGAFLAPIAVAVAILVVTVLAVAGGRRALRALRRLPSR